MLNKGAVPSTNETRAEGIQACNIRANTQVFSQKTHRIKKKIDKTAKRRVMAQQAENRRKN